MISNEISVDTYEDVIEISKVLIKNGYIVMLSREENLYIINYKWSHNCDRNDVVFMDRCDFESTYCEVVDDKDMS